MAKKKTKTIRWLTKEQIKKAATSLRPALKMSFEHWKQLAKATRKQLKYADTNDRVGIWAGYCSLCYLHQGDDFACSTSEEFAKNCEKCVLSNHYSAKNQCCKEWYECDQYWRANNGATNYRKFHKAAGKMRDRLARILKAIE